MVSLPSFDKLRMIVVSLPSFDKLRMLGLPRFSGWDCPASVDTRIR